MLFDRNLAADITFGKELLVLLDVGIIGLIAGLLYDSDFDVLDLRVLKRFLYSCLLEQLCLDRKRCRLGYLERVYDKQKS